MQSAIPSRSFHTSSRRLVSVQKALPTPPGLRHGTQSRPKPDGKHESRKPSKEAAPPAKRNELGVQLLSRKLHEQVFPGASVARPSPPFINIARDHLKAHGLDPSQGSVLPDIGFTLPPLQGADLSEHFHRIGASASHPWHGLANGLATATIPSAPTAWTIRSGWTKYAPDGSTQHVPFPTHAGSSENALVFDVETLPGAHAFPIMATAVSAHGWYAWLSPWLLGETEDPEQLIPFGDPAAPRVVVGHNVSYDRARVAEEYALAGTRTRFLDTLALHVAVRGISSHQRPAWIRHRKLKEKEREEAAEAAATQQQLLREVEDAEHDVADQERKLQLRRLRKELTDNLAQVTDVDTLDPDAGTDDLEVSSKRWEDLTSSNSLAEVARLHCGIEVDKGVRNDFMTKSREEILHGVHDYLTYCGKDVSTTHAVYAKVLPLFFQACPSPTSFAGILTMGSSFLVVNQEWERYLESAEKKYNELTGQVKRRLAQLADAARNKMESEEWKDDPWLQQLDWTPKVVRASRGIMSPEVNEHVLEEDSTRVADPIVHAEPTAPRWYRDLVIRGPTDKKIINTILPFLLHASHDDNPLRFTDEEGWHYLSDGVVTRPPTADKRKITTLLGPRHGLTNLESGFLTFSDERIARQICAGKLSASLEKEVMSLAKTICLNVGDASSDACLSQLDWISVPIPEGHTKSSKRIGLSSVKKVAAEKPPAVHWPKWYWDLTRPKKGMPPGTLDITARNTISPILLRLSWLNYPLFRSREHGWTLRVPEADKVATRTQPLWFVDTADDTLEQMRGQGYLFYKLPHKDGADANVGSPLGKTFAKFAQDGTLTSPGDEAKDALNMNAQCSYWISARDRVLNQMVVWQNRGRALGLPKDEGAGHKWGVIVPQVITMGTVTRRAIEKTWLTASNAKANRVGSELKAMVRAPPGYAIVGADVDSEELWIASLMGDAQFGLHGATAIGWMTLEGTKAAGTDLHSKTAAILGISRDQAKVFNYSRIYGAGKRHAILLLLQANAGMLPEQAEKLAAELYAKTKGKNTHKTDWFGRKFWFGGSESFVFNKLEEIAMSDKPQTPALGCGVTHALSKEYLEPGFGTDYMTSRINWVVQSSGVDYLHMLIVAMDHLCRQYAIDARYLISVHDEVRYLVSDEDRYRAALALQVANLWTRAMFAHRLGMDDLPQGVAFFSAVDVDAVLRKEVDMPCVTPSQPIPIPPGESLGIADVLARTHGGSLWADGRKMTAGKPPRLVGDVKTYQARDCLVHRAKSTHFLKAQASDDPAAVKHMARSEAKMNDPAKGQRPGGKLPRLGNGDGMDWAETVDWAAHKDVL